MPKGSHALGGNFVLAAVKPQPFGADHILGRLYATKLTTAARVIEPAMPDHEVTVKLRLTERLLPSGNLFLHGPTPSKIKTRDKIVTVRRKLRTTSFVTNAPSVGGFRPTPPD